MTTSLLLLCVEIRVSEKLNRLTNPVCHIRTYLNIKFEINYREKIVDWTRIIIIVTIQHIV